MYGNLSISDAFAKADNVLTTGAKGIAEIITLTGSVNVDFADVKTVMSDSGVAIMGSGHAEGNDRAIKAIESALSSPLLNDNQIKGATNILLNITSGKEEILMDEISEITDYIQDEAGSSAEIIWGLSKDESLESKVNVTLVATGFDSSNKLYDGNRAQKKRTVGTVKEEAEKQTVVWEGPFNHENETHPEEGMKLRIREEEKPSEESQHKKTAGQMQTLTEESMDIFKQKLVSQARKAKAKEENESTHLSEADLQQQIQEREERLKSLSIQLKTPEGLADLESQPAYVRRKVNLSPVPASSESQVSRFTLNETDEKNTQIKSNNSFLHDNVD